LSPLRECLPDARLGAGIDLGPTEGLAVGPRPLEASVDAADDHRPLELSKDTQHLEHRLPRWRGRQVDPDAWTSPRKATRCRSERPRQSTLQAAIMSNSRRVGSSSIGGPVASSKE